MIVTTAGHVDHGKTALIKALTNVDTDTLPEEKRRGMTIDLGFAYLPVPPLGAREVEPIGFVDVPGHQRFVRNMLSGVGGSDYVLLVVAADDGPMPQTREHLEILNLLEIRSGLVALTKVDRVPADRLAEVTDEILTLLKGTSLQGSPIVPISITQPGGINHLRDLLFEKARGQIVRPASGYFRMAIDRCFIIPGTGLVVTGAVNNGELCVGDAVELRGSRQPARARSVHAQNLRSLRCQVGQRCAINLSRLGRQDITRGDWIVSPSFADASSRFDARIRLSTYEKRPLASAAAVHVHIGSGYAIGRIDVLAGKSIAPGKSGLARIAVDRAICIMHGDRFVLRDNSAQRIIGGGRVIDIAPPIRGRGKPARLAALLALEIDDPVDSMKALLDCSSDGVELKTFFQNRNLTDAEASALAERSSMVRIATASGTIAFSLDHWTKIRACALGSIAAWHTKAPADVGVSVYRLFDNSEMRLGRNATIGIATKLSDDGDVVRAGMFIRLLAHEPRQDPADQLLWERVRPLLEARPSRPPTVAEISYAIEGFDRKQIEGMLKRAVRGGHVLQVSDNRFFLPQGLARLSCLLHELVEESPEGQVTAARFRDRSGLGRNLSIEVLEYFDRISFTRRKGSGRIVSSRAFNFV